MPRPPKSSKKLGRDQWALARKIEALLAGRTQQAFARELGVSRAVVSAWLSGEYSPSPELLIRLGNIAPDPDHLWFWEKAGIDRGRLRGLAEAQALQQLKSSGVTRVPALGPVAEEDLEAGYLAFLPLPSKLVGSDSLSIGWFHVPDDFMAPVLRRGDIVVVDQTEERRSPQPGDAKVKLMAGRMVAARQKSAMVVRWLELVEGDSGSERIALIPERVNEHVARDAHADHSDRSMLHAAISRGFSSLTSIATLSNPSYRGAVLDATEDEEVTILGPIICWIRKGERAG